MVAPYLYSGVASSLHLPHPLSDITDCTNTEKIYHCVMVRRQIAVIVANGLAAAPASKVASATMPIVFVTGADPVRTGLVASLNRPGGSVTGVIFSTTDLTAKQLGLLHELSPKAAVIAVLQ